MKTTNRLSLAAAFVLSAALTLSCSQMEEFDVEGPETPVEDEQVGTDAPAVDEGKLVPMSFSITETKTYIDGKEVVWEEGESIAVYDGFSVREFTMTSLESLTFEGEIAENSTYQWAVYPYSAEGISATETSVTLSLSPDQTLVDKNVAPEMLLSAGKISGNGVVLKNLISLVSVEVTKPDIASVVVEGAAVAGTATFSENGTLTSVSSESSSASATLKPSSDAFATGTYYVSVLPGLSASDLKINLVRKDGYKGTKLVSGTKLERNKIYSAGQLDNNVAEWVYEAADATALLAWHKGHNQDWKTNMATNYADAHNKVLLTGDINLGGEANKWGWKNLYCEFDGNGHKIYNVVIERAANVNFFEQVFADIHDVTFGSKDGNTYDGVSKIVSTYAGDATENQYAGLFQQAKPGQIEIKNVVSYVPVTVPETAAGRFRVAGLICKGTNDQVGCETRIEGCRTYGKVSVLYTGSATEACVVSGMVGVADLTDDSNNKLEIIDCENHADVEVLQPRVESIGGVLGKRFGNSEAKKLYLTMTGCKNYGKITHTNSAADDRCRIGGIVGDAVETSVIKDSDDKYYVTIENCENGASASVTSKGKYYCVGGVAGWICGVSMTGCKNYGSVSANDQVSHASSNTVGGIAGNVSSQINNGDASKSDATTILNNCRNEGVVSAVFNSSYSGGNTGQSGVAAGGIVGSLRSIAEFKNNDNVGNVTSVNKVNSIWVYAGGIAGHVQCSATEAGTITDCRNAGEIRAGGSSSSQLSKVGLGGIAGKLGCNVTRCGNYGPVVAENFVTSETRHGSLIGALMKTENSKVKSIISYCVVGNGGTVNGSLPSTADSVFPYGGTSNATITGTTIGGDRPSDL